jgi:hypothetical protein
MSCIQQRSLLRLKRKSGPDEWVLCWYDETNGRRIYRKRTLGTVVRHPHLRDAERAAYALRITINSEFIVPETTNFGDTKTEASRKPVPLHPAVVECLETWRKKSSYGRDEDFIFPSGSAQR